VAGTVLGGCCFRRATCNLNRLAVVCFQIAGAGFIGKVEYWGWPHRFWRIKACGAGVLLSVGVVSVGEPGGAEWLGKKFRVVGLADEPCLHPTFNSCRSNRLLLFRGLMPGARSIWPPRHEMFEWKSDG